MNGREQQEQDRLRVLALATGWFSGACCGIGLYVALGCTPADRATLARTAIDSADRGCRAYLELRREGVGTGDAGAEGGP